MKRPLVTYGLFACGAAVICGLLAWFLHASSAPAIARLVLHSKAAVKMPSLDTPDLYLVLFDGQDRKWTSATHNNAVLGDGLPISIPLPPVKEDARVFSARNIIRVEVWDAGVISDGIVDRFALRDGGGGGEHYRATAEYREEGAATFVRGLVLSSAALGFVGLVLLVRGSAIPASVLH